jgi:nonribosomal peptide synthetase DhbF
LFLNPTINALASSIQLGSYGTRDERLMPLRIGGTGRKLFCIHPAGGHVFCYLPLVAEFDSDRPVFGLQASGLEAGESLPDSIEDVAAEYIRAIQTVQPQGPYQLMGMSTGGLIAFEMSRQLKRIGEEVDLLAMLDTTVPGSDEPSFSESALLRAMAAELGCLDLMEKAPSSITLAELIDKGHEAGRLPADFSLEQAQRIANVFRNTVRMHSNYRPRAWDGPVLLLRALKRLREGDSLPDWSAFVTGHLEVIDVDCEHADLVSPAFSPQLAEHIINFAMDRAGSYQKADIR